MPKHVQTLVLAVLLMGGLGPGPAARASLVVIPFSGPISSVSTEPGPLPGFALGDSVTGTLRYDPAAVTAVLPQDDPRDVAYRLPVDLAFTGSAGFTFSGTLPALAEVRDNFFGDRLSFQSLTGLQGPAFMLALTDPAGSALTSTALPTAPDPAAFPRLFFGFVERVDGQGLGFHVGDSTLAAVPEPATLGPALIGLATLAGGGLAVRRRRVSRPRA